MKLGSEVYYRISNNKEVILEIKINYLKSYCNVHQGIVVRFCFWY